MKKIFTKIRVWFTPLTWVRTRFGRNGILLENKMINGKPYLRLRINKRNGEGTIDKDVPYSDVLMITKYPSPFGKLLGRRPKNYRGTINSLWAERGLGVRPCR